MIPCLNAQTLANSDLFGLVYCFNGNYVFSVMFAAILLIN